MALIFYLNEVDDLRMLLDFCSGILKVSPYIFNFLEKDLCRTQQFKKGCWYQNTSCIFPLYYDLLVFECMKRLTVQIIYYIVFNWVWNRLMKDNRGRGCGYNVQWQYWSLLCCVSTTAELCIYKSYPSCHSGAYSVLLKYIIIIYMVRHPIHSATSKL